MVDQDITQNNVSNATLTFPGTPPTSVSPKRTYHGRNISSMSAVLLTNGYSASAILGMTKNDLLYAFQQLPESALPDVTTV